MMMRKAPPMMIAAHMATDNTGPRWKFKNELRAFLS